MNDIEKTAKMRQIKLLIEHYTFVLDFGKTRERQRERLKELILQYEKLKKELIDKKEKNPYQL